MIEWWAEKRNIPIYSVLSRSPSIAWMLYLPAGCLPWCTTMSKQRMTGPVSFGTLHGACTCRSSAPLLQPRQQIIQPCRTLKKIIYTRIMYRLCDGEPETYQEAIDRFFRLHNGLWIRTRAGRHKKLWRKKHRRIKRLREHVVCNDTQCRMLDKMVNIEYKKPTYFVEDPYTPYHRKSNLPDYRYRPPKFLPWLVWYGTTSVLKHFWLHWPVMVIWEFLYFNVTFEFSFAISVCKSWFMSLNIDV